MKSFIPVLLLVVTQFITGQVSASTDSIVFPGAQGAGKYVTGGRGGQVLYVTSLEDDVAIAGTLRWALAKKGPKIILFKVAGIIELKSTLFISKPDVTIAGHSAPGDGICIKGHPVTVNADNVVIQFLRFRMGDQQGAQDDALKGLRNANILIDHCSMSWSTDECSSFYDNENFTMQWCILSESLRKSVHAKGDHGFGGIWGGKKATFHHNLLAHHDSRNPRFCGSRYSNQPELEKVDLINNVIFNWGSNSGYAGEGGAYNIIGNYYKPGLATLAKKGKHNFRIFAPNSDDGSNNQPAGVWGKFYLQGNLMQGSDVVSNNNQLGFHVDNRDGETMTADKLLSDNAFDFLSMIPQPAITACNEVILKAGASLKRDTVDRRIIREFEQGTFTFTGSKGSANGLIDSQEDVGGWPLYFACTTDIPADKDEDGMPDVWEVANGLNKTDKNDGNLFTLSKKYNNLEVYLFSRISHLY